MTTLDALMAERLHRPDLTPEPTQQDRALDLLRQVIAGLDEATKAQVTRHKPHRPITTSEVREARRLRHSGLTWAEVARRMGTTPNRARSAATKTIHRKATAT